MPDTHDNNGWDTFDGVDVGRGERITQAMEARAILYNCQLCYDIGVSESTLSRWRAGRPLSLSHAVDLCASLGISLHFLLTGELDRSSPEGFTAQVREFRSLFRRLSVDNERLSVSLLRCLFARPAAAAALPKIMGLAPRMGAVALAPAIPTVLRDHAVHHEEVR